MRLKGATTGAHTRVRVAGQPTQSEKLKVIMSQPRESDT